MPTYQYACTDCDHAFEQVQGFSEDSLTDCPRCEGRLRKIFNAVGVVFKGSGFYRTDSRADAKTAASANGSNGSSTNGSSSDAAKPDSGSSDGGKGTGKSDSGRSDGGKSEQPKPTKPKTEAGAA